MIRQCRVVIEDNLPDTRKVYNYTTEYDYGRFTIVKTDNLGEIYILDTSIPNNYTFYICGKELEDFVDADNSDPIIDTLKEMLGAQSIKIFPYFFKEHVERMRKDRRVEKMLRARKGLGVLKTWICLYLEDNPGVTRDNNMDFRKLLTVFKLNMHDLAIKERIQGVSKVQEVPTTTTPSRRIIIPKDIANAMSLEKGEQLKFEFIDNKIIVTRL